MQILEIQLQTHRLAEQKHFYAETLGLPLVEESSGAFAVRAGASRILFQQAPAGVRPVYHFAFNIPENQLGAAKLWLSSRVELQKNGDADEWSFDDWNAHAVYFLDAAGNVAELIARHNLANRSERPFGAHSLLSVSEIGLAAEAIRPVYQEIRQRLGVERWRGDETTFAAVGDEQGLFILVPVGRIFLASEIRAAMLPTTVVVRGQANTEFVISDTPHRIRTAETPSAVPA